eukprot:s589_g3.t1
MVFLGLLLCIAALDVAAGVHARDDLLGRGGSQATLAASTLQGGRGDLPQPPGWEQYWALAHPGGLPLRFHNEVSALGRNLLSSDIRHRENVVLWYLCSAIPVVVFLVAYYSYLQRSSKLEASATSETEADAVQSLLPQEPPRAVPAFAGRVTA